MSDRHELLDQLLKLRSPDSTASDADEERYSGFDSSELENMISALQDASAIAHSRRKETSIDDAAIRGAIRKRQMDALERLKTVADEIKIGHEQGVPSKGRSLLPVSPQREKMEIREALNAGLQRESPGLADEITRAFIIRNIKAIDYYSKEDVIDLFDDIVKIIEQDISGNLVTIRRQHKNVVEWKTDPYIMLMLQMAIRDITRITRGQKKVYTSKETNRKAFYRMIQMRSSSFEPRILVNSNPRLNVASVTEALAKMAVLSRSFRATRLISTGSGGEMVGSFLASELNLQPKVLFHYRSGSHTESSLEVAVAPLTADDRVIVVSDVASPIETLDKIRKAVVARIGGTNIAFVALAGYTATYQQMHSECLVYFANLTVTRRAKLPWGKHGKYHRTRTDHFFGEDNSHSRVKIPREFFATVIDDLEAHVE